MKASRLFDAARAEVDKTTRDAIDRMLSKFFQYRKVSSKVLPRLRWTKPLEMLSTACFPSAAKAEVDKTTREAIDRMLSKFFQYGMVTPKAEVDKTTRDAIDRMLSKFFQYGMVTPKSVEAILKALEAIDIQKEDPTFLLSSSWADLADEKTSFVRKQGSMRSLAALAHASITSKPDDPTYVGGLFVTLQSLLDRIEEIKSELGRSPGGLDQFAKPTKTKNSMIQDYRTRMEAWGLMRLAFSAARVALSKSGISKIAARSIQAARVALPKSGISKIAARSIQVSVALPKSGTSKIVARSFLAARVAQSKNAINMLAARSIQGINSTDAIGARHALALASLLARDPATCGQFISQVGPMLNNNMELAIKTGLLFSLPKSSPSAPGGIRGKGAVFWDTLVLLACKDPSDTVSLEAIKAMFGAPPPKSEGVGALAQKRGGLPPDSDSDAYTAKSYVAAWNLLKFPDQKGAAGAADGPDDSPGAASLGSFVRMKISSKPSPQSASTTYKKSASSTTSKEVTKSLFTHIATRLMSGMQSGSRSLATASIKAFVVIAEARAWSSNFSGAASQGSDSGHLVGLVNSDKPIGATECCAAAEALIWLQMSPGHLVGLVNSDKPIGATERCAAAEALIWLQMSPVNHSSTLQSATEASYSPPAGNYLSAGQLIKCVAQGGFSTSHVVRTLSSDPWPEALTTSLMTTALKRMKCSIALSENMMSLCLTVCAGCPSRVSKEGFQQILDAAPGRVSKEGFQQILDAAPGPTAVRVAMELLSSPMPLISRVASSAPVEVKLMACEEEAAYDSLRCLAAWWLGEHVNQVAGESAWRPAGKPVELAGPTGPRTSDQRMAVAAVAHAPLLALTVTHLQRAIMTKIAVRSHEPYRIQCYTVLAATQDMQGPGCAGNGDALGLGPVVLPVLEILDAMYSGMTVFEPVVCVYLCVHFYTEVTETQDIQGPGCAGNGDALGLGPVVLPVLEVMDTMCSGEIMVEQLVAEHGLTEDNWPEPILESLKKRHEWLLALVNQRVCFVPREHFCPLGPNSRLLLRPGSTSAHWDPTPDYCSGLGALLPTGTQLEITAQAWEHFSPLGPNSRLMLRPDETPDPEEEEPEMQHVKKEVHKFGGLPRSMKALDWFLILQWDGREALLMMMPHKWMGKIQGEAEDEASVTAGERIKVLIDMGDWLHVLTQAGSRGLVPASYVTIEEGTGDRYETSSNASSSFMKPQSSANNTQQEADNADQAAGYYGGYDAYGYNEETGYDYYGAGEAEAEDSSNKQGGGGYDDFGSILSTIRPVAPPPPEPEPASPTPTNEEAVAPAASSGFGHNAFGDNAFGDDAFGDDAFEAPAAAAAASGGGATIAPVHTADSSAFGEDAFASSAVPPADASPPPPAASAEAEAPPAPEEVVLLPAVVLYDFVAELESELSISAGEELVVGSEVDGWYQVTRASDGATGLVPAAYVQLS
eukprot:gene22806-29971_t